MSPQKIPLRRLYPALAGLLACLAGLIISITLAKLDIARERASAENEVRASMALIQSQLSTVIRSTFSPTDSLVHLIASQGGITDATFFGITQRLIAHTPTIRNIVIAPNDQIRQVYPLAGNEAAMGLRYKSIPAQYATVLQAKEQRRPVLAGPVPLVQGGNGFIQRYPVFIKTTEQADAVYWGVVSIVADVDKVLAAGGIKENLDIQISIVTENGRSVFGDKNLGGLSPITLRMDIPGSEWILRGAPKKGWPSLSIWSSKYLLLGIVNSLILGLLAWQLLLRQKILADQNDILASTLAAKNESEAAAQESQRLLQAIVNTAPPLIYVFDLEGRMQFCNPQVAQTIGQPFEKMIGHVRSAFLPTEIAAQHLANDQKVLATDKVLSIEEDYQERDGKHTYLTMKSPLHDATGKIIGVVGISTDITSRKQAEKDLQLSATIFDNTADGITITDPTGTIVLTNPAFTQITGYSAEEAIGQNSRILQSSRQDAEFYQNLWQTLGASGTWQGEIWNRRKNGEIYPEWLTITAVLDPSGKVSNYVGVFSDISTIKQTQAELEHLAHFDPLTDLPNRNLFHDRLSHAIERAYRYSQHVAIMVLDLDGFKTVNDSLGHPVGDQLLQQVAHRLKSCIRVEDTVARLGGDEFAIVIANLEHDEHIVDIADKILHTIESPFTIEGHSALVTTSIGIAVYPSDGLTPDLLIRNADAAMYQSKTAGKNSYHFYQPNMTEAAQLRLANEQALRRAIADQEFEVWYQPQVCLSTGVLLGAEALIRWRDPIRGLIPPIDFIPLAESNGLIITIGEYVLHQVCLDINHLLNAQLNPIKVGVNVAGPQLFRSDFVALLEQVLTEHKLPSATLEIEITETCMLQNPEQAGKILEQVQKIGIMVAIDDFGTGYSSLSHLKNLPINTLKIDRSFVSDLPDDVHDIAITRAILAMGRSLGFVVVAEGIETEAQHKFLMNEGCVKGQGYLFAKPMPLPAFKQWLIDRQQSADQTEKQ